MLTYIWEQSVPIIRRGALLHSTMAKLFREKLVCNKDSPRGPEDTRCEDARVISLGLRELVPKNFVSYKGSLGFPAL